MPQVRIVYPSLSLVDATTLIPGTGEVIAGTAASTMTHGWFWRY